MTPREHRNAQLATNEIEHEYDFLFKCKRNETLRCNFLRKVEVKDNSFKNKFKNVNFYTYSFNNKKLINLFAKFVYSSFSHKRGSK